jgi:hypothetical protein
MAMAGFSVCSNSVLTVLHARNAPMQGRSNSLALSFVQQSARGVMMASGRNGRATVTQCPCRAAA